MQFKINLPNTAFVSTAVLVGAIASATGPKSAAKPHSLVGAWRSKVQFVTGPYAAVKDLKFLLVVNAGGTLTESSNYDESPPVVPAYGIWRKTGRGAFEFRYEYYNSKAPKKSEDLMEGGWLPGGWGVLKEVVKLSPDGNSYTSTISFVLRDEHGKIVPGGKAICKGERMKF